MPNKKSIKNKECNMCGQSPCECGTSMLHEEDEDMEIDMEDEVKDELNDDMEDEMGDGLDDDVEFNDD